MTRVAELPGESVTLNPEAPFPPFPVWLRIPSAWDLLDTNPGTWLRSARSLVDVSFGAAHLPARDRRAAVTVIEDLVSECQRAGAALSLLSLGRTPDGQVASAGIHLAFAGDDRPATLGRVHDMLSRTGTTSEIDTGVGPAIVHRDRTTMMVPGTATLKTLTSIQIFVPVPDTCWTVVLSTASAFPELTDPLERILVAMATSVQRTDSADATGSDPADDGGSSDDGGTAGEVVAEPAPGAQGPGIERGFGTMLLRRLTPPEGRT